MSLDFHSPQPRTYTWVCYRCRREVSSPIDARCPECSFLLVIECEGTPPPGLWREELDLARTALRRELRLEEQKREAKRHPLVALLAGLVSKKVGRHGA